MKSSIPTDLAVSRCGNNALSDVLPVVHPAISETRLHTLGLLDLNLDLPYNIL